MPGSRHEVFESAGHFQFNREPERFVDALTDFIPPPKPPRSRSTACGDCSGARLDVAHGLVVQLDRLYPGWCRRG
jgi:hypothetical protein